MTPNKRDLKAYSRFDGTGRIVPGSTVLRRSKPKVGTWIEVQAYECCNVDQTPILLSRRIPFPIAYLSIVIIPSDGDSYIPMYGYTGDTVANTDELLLVLNTTLKSFGSFKDVNGDVYLTPSISLANFFKANNTTILTGDIFAD